MAKNKGKKKKNKAAVAASYILEVANNDIVASPLSTMPALDYDFEKDPRPASS